MYLERKHSGCAGQTTCTVALEQRKIQAFHTSVTYSELESKGEQCAQMDSQITVISVLLNKN